jgi:hypothetical protein
VLRLDRHHGGQWPGRRADRGRRCASTRTSRSGRPAQGCPGQEDQVRARLVPASFVLAHLALTKPALSRLSSARLALAQLVLARLVPAQLVLARLPPARLVPAQLPPARLVPAQLPREGRDRHSGRSHRADRTRPAKAGIGATAPPWTGPTEAGLTRAEPTVAGLSPIEPVPIESVPIELAPTSLGWSSTTQIETTRPWMTGCPGQGRMTMARPDSTTNLSTRAVRTYAIEPTGSAIQADQPSV